MPGKPLSLSISTPFLATWDQRLVTRVIFYSRLPPRCSSRRVIRWPSRSATDPLLQICSQASSSSMESPLSGARPAWGGRNSDAGMNGHAAAAACPQNWPSVLVLPFQAQTDSSTASAASNLAGRRRNRPQRRRRQRRSLLRSPRRAPKGRRRRRRRARTSLTQRLLRKLRVNLRRRRPQAA